MSYEPGLEYIDFRPLAKLGLRWVVMGGDNAPRAKARPFDVRWPRQMIRDWPRWRRSLPVSQARASMVRALRAGAKTQRRRSQDPEKFRARERAASKKRPVDKKVLARRALNGAVRRGKILRPSTCERCGQVRKVVTGHHPDYSKPLEVEWLCYECHGNE